MRAGEVCVCVCVWQVTRVKSTGAALVQVSVKFKYIRRAIFLRKFQNQA